MPKFSLPDLSFAQEALEPYLSRETIKYHYGKHHQGYVTKLTKLIEGTVYAEQNLENIVKNSFSKDMLIFNNSAQIWNHNFYWQCLTPKSQQAPSGQLAETINKNFGSFESFQIKFKEHALANFGSGWTWLTKREDGSLAILNTSNAMNLLTTKYTALLTCDVWEHAYYIDYRNERDRYIDNFWKMVNWDFVSNNF